MYPFLPKKRGVFIRSQLNQENEAKEKEIKNSKQEAKPAARVGFAVVQRTVYDFLRQGKAFQEGYCDFVAALAGAAVEIFLSDQAQFQFFHETAPENENRPAEIKLHNMDLKTKIKGSFKSEFPITRPLNW